MCDAGYTGSPSSGPCTGCDPGKFKSTAYNNAVCIDCPDNSGSPGSSDELNDCVGVAGYYGQGPAVTACATAREQCSEQP